jgi:uroporphyrinogen decarboxylase
MSISTKERFLGVCHFERPGDLYLSAPYFNSFWNGTLEGWVKQGAPKEILNSRFLGEYFQFNHTRILHEIVSGSAMDAKIDIGTAVPYTYEVTPLVPLYEPQIISQDERTVTLVNGGGQTVKVFKDNPIKMPMFLKYPVKDKASWNEYKKRLEPHSPGRFPDDWNAYTRKINSKDEPIMLFVGSFFGFLREWVGLESLLFMFYDNPKLIQDMMEQVFYLSAEIIKRVVKDIRVDHAMFWEDMAFKSGPLVSPAMVKKFMVPHYKKITELLHSNGVEVIFVDSDGNLSELIPIWLECGINGVWPLECAAGNDAVALRKKYGRELVIAGTIDKRALLKKKEAIREEVMSKVPFLLEQGGYFPSVDHMVPPDIPWENYRYFISTLREVGGLEKLPE